MGTAGDRRGVAGDADEGEQFLIASSRGFPAWLAKIGASVMFTSYQSGKLFCIGLDSGGAPTIFKRNFPRSMGLALSEDGRSLMLATLYQIMKFDRIEAPADQPAECDAVFGPHVAWITGDIDVHDIAIASDGRPVFVSTAYSCVATVSEGYSFRPLWRPPFISALDPEDRCHLNGLALKDGRPRYVTLVAASDRPGGWRERRADGGMLMDMDSGKVLLEGLSMPHSPRVHQGRIWLLNSGAGEFGYLDEAAGRFQPVSFCPGYARGLTFIGDYAVVGVSMARDNQNFLGLPLQEILAARGAEPICALLVVDIRTGETVEWMRIQGSKVRELYDVAALPGVRNPTIVGFMNDDVARLVSVGPATTA
jgi:uncharacterized protein (TIGR03032 family)